MGDADQPDESNRGSDMDPERHYDEFGEGEWERLESNPVARMELENTLEILTAVLPKDGVVLDAGGGPGRYSIWLAKRGYRVEHVDVSAEQVRLAREKADEHGVGAQITARKGDIRDLDFEGEHFDAVCCLGGPLSHVIDASDRNRAVRELSRVARPGAPVVVSVIGRLNALRDGIRHGLDEHPGLLPEIAETGDFTQALIDEYGGEGWAECHFFRARELETLLSAAGLDVTQLVGLEGPASSMQPELSTASDAAVAAVEEVVDMLKTDPTVVDSSEHILAVADA